MAIGDAAAAKGMDLVEVTDELNDGADEINRTRDYLADAIDDFNAALSGKLDSTKIAAGTSLPGVVVNGQLFIKYSA